MKFGTQIVSRSALRRSTTVKKWRWNEEYILRSQITRFITNHFRAISTKTALILASAVNRFAAIASVL